MVVVPNSNARIILQVQKNLGAFSELERIRKRYDKQKKFASLIFVVYAWYLTKEELNRFREELENKGCKLIVFSLGFKELLEDELFELIKEIQNAVT